MLPRRRLIRDHKSNHRSRPPRDQLYKSHAGQLMKDPIGPTDTPAHCLSHRTLSARENAAAFSEEGEEPNTSRSFAAPHSRVRERTVRGRVRQGRTRRSPHHLRVGREAFARVFGRSLARCSAERSGVLCVFVNTENAGIVEFLHKAFNQRGEMVAECRRQAMMRKRPKA